MTDRETVSDCPEVVAPASAVPQDGRRAWRERNRLAVVDALLDLYAEGNLRPDAAEVAERSGVSRRSVFRYFDDRDDLDRAAIERQQQRVRHLIEVASIGEGTLSDRILRLAEQRATLFEQIRPAAQVSRLRAPFHKVIAEELGQSRRFLTRQVECQFATELSGMNGAERRETLSASDAFCSFETYDFLRERGLAAAETAAVMRRALEALFASPPRA
ncbi:MAG: TetR/AcrR family transcriptional regulator [Anaerolineaceae bacterium]